MPKKHPRRDGPTGPNRRKKSSRPADFAQNGDSAQKSDSEDPDRFDFDGEGGKRTYSDVFTIGREQNIAREGKTNRRIKEDRQSSNPAFTRILSSNDFLREYGKIYPKGENRPSLQQDTGNNGGKGSERSNQRAEKTENDPAAGRRGKNVGSEPGSRGKAVGLRIIGGKFRALKLEYSGDHRVRPMKDRLRESVFNLIGTLATGKHAVDLFAGTGALAFEALSRGAESATLVEVHFPTARVIRNNIKRLEEKALGIASRIDLKTTDVFFWGRNTDSLAEMPHNRPWLVFCSPPYDFYVDRGDDLLELLHNVAEAAPADSVFVVEADNRFDFDRLGVPIAPKKRKSYPPAEIAVYTLPTRGE